MTTADLLRALHAAARTAGLDEDGRRDLLETRTGHRSAKDCTESQLRDVIAHLNRAIGGFKPSSRPEIRKIYALWGELKRREVLDNPTKAGLRAFCGRMANLQGQAATDPEFLDGVQARKVTEALKAWIGRLDAGAP